MRTREKGSPLAAVMYALCRQRGEQGGEGDHSLVREKEKDMLTWAETKWRNDAQHV